MRMNPTGTDLAVVKPWASLIRNHLQKGIESFILAGHDLDAAVEDFKQQDGKHWKHKYSELLAEVKLSQQTAHTLRTIARHPILSDPSNYGSLPGSWSTLGELASLPSPELEQRIEAGEITPDLKREQVRQWKQLNHLPASGSLQVGSNLEPVIVGHGMPSEYETMFPDDITLKECVECMNRSIIFVGLFGENIRLAAKQLHKFTESGDPAYLPPPGEPSFMQMLNRRAKAPVFWAAYLTSLESDRPVIGVFVPPQKTKRPGVGQDAANTKQGL